MYFLSRSGAEFRSSYPGEDVAKVELMFDEAEKEAKKGKGALIFIDEVESLLPIRADLHSGQHDIESLINFFFARMEGMESRGKVVVLAATNQPDKLDPAARRRFDKRITVPVPTQEGRLMIFRIHTRKMPLDDDVNLDELVEKTHGFVGNDIEHLCIEASLKARKEIKGKLKDGTLPSGGLKTLKIKKNNFFDVLQNMRPSGLGSAVITNTGVTFDDIAGLDKCKKELMREIDILLNKSALYKKAGMKARKGMLLVGWPGCGKTLLAKGLANECRMNFISIKGSEIHSMWFSVSEKTLSGVFKIARIHAPSVIFLDEIDSLLPLRGSGIGGTKVAERLVAAFNTEMDGVEELKNVIVLAATNRIDLVDPAVIRRLCSGGNPIFIPTLDAKGREEAFKIHARNKSLADDVDFKKLSELTRERDFVIPFQDRTFRIRVSFNGDEIRGICEEATRMALDEFVQEKGEEVANDCAEDFLIYQRHFEKSVSTKLVKEKKEHASDDSLNSPEPKPTDDFSLSLDEEEIGFPLDDEGENDTSHVDKCGGGCGGQGQGGCGNCGEKDN